jgi:hypothetical protein
MEHIILVADKINQNGRVYPYDIVKDIVEQAKREINLTRFLVERHGENVSEVNLENVVGLVKDINLNEDTKEVSISVKPLLGNDWIVEALESGKVHLRTKGIGTFKQSDSDYPMVLDSFELKSVFLTSDPA